jgi:hypothetical protein
MAACRVGLIPLTTRPIGADQALGNGPATRTEESTAKVYGFEQSGGGDKGTQIITKGGKIIGLTCRLAREMQKN